ncbi:MAG: PAS domain S-box protein [Bacteriovoracaceae bacterium]
MNSAQLLAIFNSMAEGVVIYDHEGKISHFNSSALNILGITEDELREKCRPVQKNLTFPWRLKNGTVRWLSSTTVPVEDGTEAGVSVIQTFSDVTNERLARDFLNVTLDSLPVLVNYVDRDLHYVYVNQRYEEWFGRRRKEIIGKKVGELIGAEAFQMLEPYLRKVLEGEAQEFEMKVTYKDAGERQVQVTLIPDKAGGEVHGYYTIINDVTAMVAAREKIRAIEAEERSLLDSVPTLLSHWTKDLINVHANKAFAEFLNTRPEMLKGKRIDEVVPPEILSRSMPYVRKVLTGKPQQFERILVDSHGRKKYMLVTYSPEIVNGEVIGAFTASHDVTELKLSEAKFKSFLELSPDPIIIINGEGIIEMVNRQTEEEYGYTKQEIVGHSFLDLLPAGDHENIKKRFEEYIRYPTRKTFDEGLGVLARRKDGSVFPFEISIGPLQTEGKILLKCVIRNISERLKANKEKENLLEREKKARVQAEEAIKMRDEMLAVVSHDLRNPISAIQGYIDLLVRMRKDDSELVEKLGRMRNSTSRTLSMIQDLLDIYKMEEGNFDIEAGRGTYATEEIMAEAYDSQEILARNKNITLLMKLEERLPSLSVDLGHILRVIQNLMSNALKFTPSGGTITLSARASEGSVLFAVEDTGPGIEKEILPTMFSRFVQGKSKSHLGIGLGLPICKGIVEAHGGKIWIESHPGQGTKISFTIPVPLEQHQHLH